MHVSNSSGTCCISKSLRPLACCTALSMMLGVGSAIAQGTVPGQVSNLVANVQSPGGTTVHLTWDSATDAQGYEVWRAAGVDFAGAELLGTNGQAVLRYDDDQTRAETNYIYSVRAFNSAGPGDFAVPVVAGQTNLLWAVPFSLGVPVVGTDGTIIVAGRDVTNANHSRITAYDRRGSVLWSYQDNDYVVGGPTLAGSGRLVFNSVTSQGGCVRALDHTGQLLWTTARIGTLRGDAVVDAYGTAYVISYESSPISGYRIWAVSADGVLVWNKFKPGSSPPLPDHAVLGQDGRSYLNLITSLSGFSATGDVLFYFDRRYTSREWGTPAINDAGELVLGSFSGLLASYMSYDASGNLLISNYVARVSCQSRREPVISADGRVYFVADKTVVCVATNGLLLWTNQFQTSVSSGSANVPALDEAGNVYVAGTSELVVLDRDGQAMKRVELASSPTTPPVLTSEGMLYIATGTRLYALQALAGLSRSAPWPMCRRDPAGTACSDPTVTRPDAPNLLPPRPFANKIRIEWTTPPRPAALELFRSATPEFSAASLIIQSRAGETFADDTTASLGTRYYYWARLQNAGGTSDFSGPVQAMAVEVPVKWFTAVSNLMSVPPAIAPDGKIYACATDNLVALNTNGSVLWQLPGYTGSPLVSPDGAIVIRSGNRVCSLSPAGTTNWAMEGITSYGGLVPAVGADGRTILNRINDEVMAVSATGSILWQVRYTNYSLSIPSIGADGSVVFRQSNTRLTRLTAEGSEALSVTFNNEWYQAVVTPVLDAEGTLYLPCGSPSSLSATRADGSNKWRFSSIGSAQVTPVVGMDGTVFVGYPVQSVGQVAALGSDGSVLWTFDLDQPTAGLMALSAEGTLLVAAGTNLFALTASDGTQVWKMNSPNSEGFGAPVLDYDGSLYVPAGNGILALQLDTGPARSAWPMFRQNPRQSACIQRLADPEICDCYATPGFMNLEVLAPGGGIILRSTDLKTWSRVGFQPPASSAPVTWTFEATSQPVGFFRILAP